MLFVISGQFNQENFKFVNFPDFCGYATTVILHLKISILDSPTDCNHMFKKIFSRKHMFAKFCFLKLVSDKVHIHRVHLVWEGVSTDCMRQNLEILSPFMYSTSGSPNHLLFM